MWFGSWSELGRVVAVGASAYLTLVLILRLSGKRTLSKLSAFDFVVTVALGSTLATILLSEDVSWAQGVVALVLLAALQFTLSWTMRQVPWSQNVVTSKPSLLLVDGRFLTAAMSRQRVTEDQVRQAIRSTGQGSISDIGAVVLETDGNLSVIPKSHTGDRSALRGLELLPADDPQRRDAR